MLLTSEKAPVEVLNEVIKEAVDLLSTTKQAAFWEKVSLKSDELVELVDAARQDGFSLGHGKGFDAGYEKGYHDGHTDQIEEETGDG